MSLLDRGTETVTVFPEEIVTDSDGNKRTRPALIGALVRAVVQPISSTANADGGFNTETRYRLRLITSPNILGAQTQIEWNGKRYSILGDAMIYNGSRRTAHVEYVMVRK
jgi:hypothetical protein